MRWSLGPLGLFAQLYPPMLQHLGGVGAAGGLSLGLHGELALGRAPFDGGGALPTTTESLSLLAGWEWWRLRADLLAGYQQADGAAYRGAQAGLALWLRLGRGVYLGGEGLVRIGNHDELHEAHGALTLRLLDDSGLALLAAGAWRVPLREPAARSWRVALGFGVSYGPGYDSRWLRELLRLPELGPVLPPLVPPPVLRAPPLPLPPPGAACALDPMGGPPLYLAALERAPDPLSRWRSYRACQVAGWAAAQGRGAELAQAGPYRPLPPGGTPFRPLPGWAGTGPRWPESEREEPRPERPAPAPGQPGFRGWREGQPVPPWWWRLPVPQLPSIGPAAGAAASAAEAPAAEPARPPAEPRAPAPEAAVPEPPPSARTPRGSQNPRVSEAARAGTRAHADRAGQLPDQLREELSETKLQFNKPGQPGPDVKVIGGKPPWEYPGSTWPKGVLYGDFKPDTPGGRRTFARDQRTKWEEPVHMLPYDPTTGRLRW